MYISALIMHTVLQRLQVNETGKRGRILVAPRRLGEGVTRDTPNGLSRQLANDAYV